MNVSEIKEHAMKLCKKYPNVWGGRNKFLLQKAMDVHLPRCVEVFVKLKNTRFQNVYLYASSHTFTPETGRENEKGYMLLFNDLSDTVNRKKKIHLKVRRTLQTSASCILGQNSQ
jgi:hypothetical protein